MSAVTSEAGTRVVTGHQVIAINIPARGNLLRTQNSNCQIHRTGAAPRIQTQTQPFMKFSESSPDILLFGEVISESDKFYEFSW